MANADNELPDDWREALRLAALRLSAEREDNDPMQFIRSFPTQAAYAEWFATATPTERETIKCLIGVDLDRI